MNKKDVFINTFFLISLVLETMGYLISFSLVKLLNIDITLSLIPFILMGVISIILTVFYFCKRLQILTIIKSHISEKTYWMDLFVIIIFILHIIFNSITIFVYIKIYEQWFFIFSLITSLLIFSVAIISFFRSTLRVNKELSERRTRGANE